MLMLRAILNYNNFEQIRVAFTRTCNVGKIRVEEVHELRCD